ncbi:MAG: hypothetical protein WC956_07820 [bacterium]
MDLEPALPIIDAYLERSKGLVNPGAQFFSPSPFFVTDEPRNPVALSSIKGKGGACIGIGQSLSLTYAAWLGAHHAYVIDLNGHVPFSFVPAYGSLLCMARSRLEFLSLVLGIPIPESFGIQSENTDSPQRIFDMILGCGSFDQDFFKSVSIAIATAIASRGPLSDNGVIFQAVQGWLSRFGTEYRNDIQNQEIPLEALQLSDKEGQGRLLSTETAFQRKRRLFMEGRLTGVAGDITDGCLLDVSLDMIARKLSAQVVYLANAEAWIMDHAMHAVEEGGPDAQAMQLKRIVSFYSDLNCIPSAPDALLISANTLMHTWVGRLRRYLKLSFPPGRPELDAAKAAVEFFPIRTHAGSMQNKSPARIIHSLVMAHELPLKVSQRLRIALVAVADIFEGHPPDAATVRLRLSKDPSTIGMFEPWEIELLINNLQELRVVEKD